MAASGRGGLVLGLLLLVLPQMYGVGYPVIEGAIAGGFPLGLLVALLVGKIVATSLTIAMGGSGGVFAPSLFIGAMLGSCYGGLLHRIAPALTGPAGAYGLIGMGAVFAAAARAPLTSVIIIFELTGEYRIILPLLFAVGVATWISNLITRDTIYTLKLRRRGVVLSREGAPNPMHSMTVRDAMEAVPRPLRHDETLASAVKRFAEEHRDALPMVDAEGLYRGVVTAREIEAAMRDNEPNAPISGVAKGATTVTSGQRLDAAMAALVRDDVAGLAVLDDEKKVAVGWLTHRSVLRAYRERIDADTGKHST